MIKRFLLAGILAGSALAQVQNFKPVTKEMLENPSPDDWLMFSRTYDAQRFSPLKEITRQNVAKLRMVWTRGLGPGDTETIPLVHDGVMYTIAPGTQSCRRSMQPPAIFSGSTNAKSSRQPGTGRATPKALAIYQDLHPLHRARRGRWPRCTHRRAAVGR